MRWISAFVVTLNVFVAKGCLHHEHSSFTKWPIRRSSIFSGSNGIHSNLLVGIVGRRYPILNHSLNREIQHFGKYRTLANFALRELGSYIGMVFFYSCSLMCFFLNWSLFTESKNDTTQNNRNSARPPIHKKRSPIPFGMRPLTQGGYPQARF